MERATVKINNGLRRRVRLGGVGLSLLLLWSGSGCGPVRGAGGSDDRLTIGAYSVVREAFREKILPGFAAHWRKTTGRQVRFEESYNASGAQSRAIASGFDADVAVLSLE